jgi:hypothetical protein
LTENDVLDRFASAYNVKRKPRESDAALRARVRAVMMGGFLLLAGCAHPQPVNPGYQPTAWFVVDGEVWHCDASAKVLCRRFGVATPAEGK